MCSDFECAKKCKCINEPVCEENPCVYIIRNPCIICLWGGICPFSSVNKKKKKKNYN